MTITRSDGLTPNEIKFMDLWYEVSKVPHRVTSGSIDQAAGFLGVQRTGNCSTCLRMDATVINNRYRLLLPAYEIYLDTKKSFEATKPVQPVVQTNAVAKDWENVNEIETVKPVKKTTKK